MDFVFVFLTSRLRLSRPTICRLGGHADHVLWSGSTNWRIRAEPIGNDGYWTRLLWLGYCSRFHLGAAVPEVCLGPSLLDIHS